MTVLGLETHGNVYLLAAAFANSVTFQDVLGKYTEADVLERIHYPDVIFEDDDSGNSAMYCELLPPRIIIADELGEDELTQGGIHTWSRAEAFWVSFDFAVPWEYSKEGRRNSWAWMKNNVQGILKDIRNLGSTGQVTGTHLAYPVIRAARRLEGPYQLDMAEVPFDDDRDSPEQGRRPEIWHMAWEITRGF